MRKDRHDGVEDGDALNQLELLVMSGKLGRRRFMTLATTLGVSAVAAAVMVEKALAIAENQTARARELKSSYDYIVCGGGSSGAVVASRLSEDPNVQVLLLEAGGADDAPSILDPAVWYTNIGGQFDWGYKSVVQQGLNNRTIALPMGKALGGGSSINGMIWARGHKNDFDFWARETGDAAWGYEHVLGIYRRIEDWQGEPDPSRRGKGGIVHVQPMRDPSPLALAMLEGAASVGIPTFADQNGAMMEGDGGAAIANGCIKDGRRRNVASHYLHPVMDRPNLTVLTRAFTRQLVFAGKKVTGVKVEWGGRVRHVGAHREVVLSCGAINTPKILMLSGIGDAHDLRSLGIAVRADLPGVGKNFQDHTMVASCMWESSEAVRPRNNSAEATFFWKSDSRLDTPDLQPFQIEIPYTSEALANRAVPNGWTIAPGLVRPKSRGYLKLTANDPHAAMEIHGNFLQDSRDLKALRAGVELCRDIGNSAAMRPFVKREVMPGPVRGAALDRFIRDSGVSYFHQTCTAKMGRDRMSVVDAKLRVYGIDNLRIADGSVMPRVTTGNTMAPCVVIGERMAEILRAS